MSARMDRSDVILRSRAGRVTVLNGGEKLGVDDGTEMSHKEYYRRKGNRVMIVYYNPPDDWRSSMRQ